MLRGQDCKSGAVAALQLTDEAMGILITQVLLVPLPTRFERALVLKAGGSKVLRLYLVNPKFSSMTC